MEKRLLVAIIASFVFPVIKSLENFARMSFSLGAVTTSALTNLHYSHFIYGILGMSGACLFSAKRFPLVAAATCAFVAMSGWLLFAWIRGMPSSEGVVFAFIYSCVSWFLIGLLSALTAELIVSNWPFRKTGRKRSRRLPQEHKVYDLD